MDLEPALVHPLEIRVPANVFVSPKARHKLLPDNYSLLTVRRFRPLARRRLSTSRPFFVLMRTRKPCVLLRCRLFG
jgi:hypothetical protein